MEKGGDRMGLGGPPGRGWNREGGGTPHLLPPGPWTALAWPAPSPPLTAEDKRLAGYVCVPPPPPTLSSVPHGGSVSGDIQK
ncbi:hypothetical protein E2320_009428 [Naja naja]|nr:hypothetical protein E2320_009428 [Naja naja]